MMRHDIEDILTNPCLKNMSKTIPREWVADGGRVQHNTGWRGCDGPRAGRGGQEAADTGTLGGP